MSKDKEKKDWFRGIDINPFRFKRSSYLPFFDESADYNTNSKSYYDYLARINRILEVMKHFIVRLLDRDVKVKETNTVELKKEGDWIDNGEGNPPNNYDDEIILSADVKRSEEKETVMLNDNLYLVGNSLKEKPDGLFSPDYTELMEEFEAGGGGTELDYSIETEQRNYSNLQSQPFEIYNGSENKGEEEIHELWSPDYGNVLDSVNNHIGAMNRKINDFELQLQDFIANPPEPEWGEILDTLMPREHKFYTYSYDSLGNEVGRSDRISYTLNASGTSVDLSPGNQEIIISFTPILNNTEQYEIHEIQLRNGSGYTAKRHFSEGNDFMNNTSIEMNLHDVKNGVRRHIRMSDLYDSNFTFGNNRVLVPILRNKATSAQHTAWDIDGEKQYPQTQDDFNNFTFYLKDVEVRVINQLDDIVEE